MSTGRTAYTLERVYSRLAIVLMVLMCTIATAFTLTLLALSGRIVDQANIIPPATRSVKIGADGIADRAPDGVHRGFCNRFDHAALHRRVFEALGHVLAHHKGPICVSPVAVGRVKFAKLKCSRTALPSVAVRHPRRGRRTTHCDPVKEI